MPNTLWFMIYWQITGDNKTYQALCHDENAALDLWDGLQQIEKVEWAEVIKYDIPLSFTELLNINAPANTQLQ